MVLPGFYYIGDFVVNEFTRFSCIGDFVACDFTAIRCIGDSVVNGIFMTFVFRQLCLGGLITQAGRNVLGTLNPVSFGLSICCSLSLVMTEAIAVKGFPRFSWLCYL